MISCNGRMKKVRQQGKKTGNTTGKTDKQPKKSVGQVIYFMHLNTWKWSHKGQLKHEEYNLKNWLYHL